jgi:hypothetical protein
MVFPQVKEVGDIGLTNQSCKRSNICPVIPNEGGGHDPLGVECQFYFAWPMTDQQLKYALPIYLFSIL